MAIEHKSVIICGCDIEDRRRIENFLGQGFMVTGVTDPERKEDLFEDEPAFFPVEGLRNRSFDYVVVAPLNEGIQDRWKKILLDCGIDREKIVLPCVLWPNSSAKYHEDMVKTIRENDDDDVVNGLIFGLSYSRKGIDRSMLSGKWFDFSSDGMDLYYNMQLYKYALKYNKFPVAKKAMIVAPNYYFQYDQSRSYAQYTSGQMFAVHELNDYHNFQKTGGDFPKVKNYIINYQMFGKKISDYYHVHRVTNSSTVWDGRDGEGKLPAGWLKIHEETIPEYKEIFGEFIRLLSINGLKIIVLQPPIYIKGIDDEQKEQLFARNEDFRKIVYEAAAKIGCNISTFDFTSAFKEKREFFRDLEHLNANGAVEWGKIINEQVLE